MKDFILKLNSNKCSACSIQMHESLSLLIKHYPNIRVESGEVDQLSMIAVYLNGQKLNDIKGYQPYEILEQYLLSIS